MYGQEVNPETYAISKADLILKGEGIEADNMQFGSTLSADAFPAREFDFMLSNPPYGKSWKTDLERMGGKGSMLDPRFVIEHDGDPELSLITRSSDGQMMFLANMLNKMKQNTPLGSRIAEVHNGSSLFTGDAGQGESNIRRWIIESDWLEAIIALPLNMFYNTGIATYIWVLTNRKPEQRRGKVQLIDATQWFQPLRKNLGSKNCQLPDEDAEIGPVPTESGGQKPEPEMDRLSNIIKEFNDRFGNIEWKDPDKIKKVITEELPVKVAADRAYQNAMANSDQQNARIEYNKALERAMTELLVDHTELFKQFSDNESFRRGLSEMVFAITYDRAAALSGTSAQGQQSAE